MSALRDVIKIMSLLFIVLACSEKKVEPKDFGNIYSKNVLYSKGFVGIRYEQFANLVLLPKDANQTLAGFDEKGQLIDSNMIYPKWLLPKSIKQFKKFRIAIVEFAPSPNGASTDEFKVKVTTGDEVFKDCMGLIVFKLDNKTTECFDRKLGSTLENVRYLISEAEDWGDIPKIHALKITPNGSMKTYDQVERTLAGEFLSNLKVYPASNEEYLGFVASGVAFKVNQATDDNPEAPFKYVFYSSREERDGSIREVKYVLDASQILSYGKGGIAFLSADRLRLQSASPGFPISDLICKIKLDNENKPFDQNAKIIRASYDAFANSKGQILRIFYDREFCTSSTFETTEDVVEARIQGDLFLYKEKTMGLMAQYRFNGISISLVSDYSIDYFEILEDGKSVFFTGKDKSGKNLSGIFDAMGESRYVTYFDIE
ncbi:MAG: hypothetical protein EOP48_00940 [Sphingobacteriales bacterium]|nr:MAG: hypothetical protein EOP48_00940 [Sphingobacteriales bacterium]